jgi:hypothetical protein
LTPPDEIAIVYILSLLPLHPRSCRIYFAIKSPGMTDAARLTKCILTSSGYR